MKTKRHYTICTPTGGYWFGANAVNPNDSVSELEHNANPVDWGTKKEAEEEILEAIRFSKKQGWFKGQEEDFYLEPWG